MGETALVTGVAGQDGSYLAELLLREGHRVVGVLRRNSVPEHQDSRIAHLEGQIETYYGDMQDYHSLSEIVRHVEPDMVFNLASQSHVRISFEIPQYTVDVNAAGVMRLLEAVRRFAPDARFYQASSSEMFGNSVDEDGCQRATTPMEPTSPYGLAKLFAYKTVRHYRRAYRMHASNGILFNHESPRRASNFVTAKVVKTAVQIKRRKAKMLALGNLDSKRDWGHSQDYVRAIYKIVRYSSPLDIVVATGQTRSVRDLCDAVFSRLGLDYQDYVVQDERYMRPEELRYLRGDPSGAKALLGWEPEYTFDSMVDEMLDYWTKEIP